EWTTEDGERPRVPVEPVRPEDVGEPLRPVQPPGAVRLSLDLRGGEQDRPLVADGEEFPEQRGPEAVPLETWRHVQLGQFHEVARQFAPLVAETTRHLLVPPLAGGPAVAVADGDESARRVTEEPPSGRLEGGDPRPALAPAVLRPRRGPGPDHLRGVPHRLHVDLQGLRQSAAELARLQARDHGVHPLHLITGRRSRVAVVSDPGDTGRSTEEVRCRGTRRSVVNQQLVADPSRSGVWAGPSSTVGSRSRRPPLGSGSSRRTAPPGPRPAPCWPPAPGGAGRPTCGTGSPQSIPTWGSGPPCCAGIRGWRPRWRTVCPGPWTRGWLMTSCGRWGGSSTSSTTGWGSWDRSREGVWRRFRDPGGGRVGNPGGQCRVALV